MPTSLQSFIDRPYRKTDLDALVEIEGEAGDARWNRKTIVFFAKQWVRDIRVIVTDETESVPIGFYAVEHGDRWLYISNIAVTKCWRRQGVASFGLGSIESMACNLSYQLIKLDVQEENLAAQLLYKKAGFEAVEIRRKLYGVQDGYHMIKKL